MELKFTNKSIVVVGGTSGINRGIAEAFARHGARVAVASRSQAKVDDTVAALTGLGASDAVGFSADVRDLEALQRGLDGVRDRFGEFDAVVSGAAGNFPALAANLSSNGFRAVTEIDLLGTFHVMKAIYPHLRKPGASIVNISAPQAFVPIKAQVHVGAAKAGVDMITRTLALEWGGEGIRVNSVVPGPIEGTEGMDRLAPDPRMRERVAETVPLGRLGRPDDVANACLFLTSELGAYVTGAVLTVDGGWSQTGCGAFGDYLAAIAKEGRRRDGS